ncbi:hydroxyacylglutathione hydrolase [Salsuginibacillus halophilus]|uniref:Hydroxyacylglutathione hydrolase n=1 Tax=Salsuginibacillus halophilus TaxID=517424 RepID=A0A2P8HI51_9BACI|nr:MBL fold metallo-hydrolase [Salsuginibacillus halophilus]PSL45850.1 hydroxyacylglutathione hydrolase [Salsuginibacillus halophilus]
MYFERFYHTPLAQASYLVACQSTGEAVVVDPARDIQQYLNAAEREGLHIVGSLETHIHADFVSGARELYDTCNASIYVSGEGNDEFSTYTYDEGVSLMKEGDTVTIGNIELKAMHTPGHTPEHLTFKLTDYSRSNQPMGMFTGDFLFVGDVGRPDLLEASVGVAESAKEGAKQLFHSLERLKHEPGFVQVWPGHGAGSPCGKAMDAVPVSTLGYELVSNPALQFEDQQSFSDFLLDSQPVPPPYFSVMKKVNRDGAQLIEETKSAVSFKDDADHLAKLADQDVQVLDARMPEPFSNGFAPGSINIPYVRIFTEWAGWMLDYERPIYVIAPEANIAGVVKELRSIGLDQVAGTFNEQVLTNFESSERNLLTYTTVHAPDVADEIQNGTLQPVDVRRSSEWEDGRVPGAVHEFLGDIDEWKSEHNEDEPLVLYCRTGKRSAIGASILRNEGFTNVRNMDGGFMAWKAKYDVEKD